MAKIEQVIADAMSDAVDRYEIIGTPVLPDVYRQDVLEALAGIWEPAITDEANAIADEFKEGFLHIETKEAPEFFRRIIEEFIAQYGAQKVSQIVEATREQLQRLILAGTKEGLGVAEIAKTIREKIPQIAALRANVIARTETHTSSIYGGLQAAKESRVPLKKEWISAEDHRTRDFGSGDGVVDEFSHRAMDGVRVEMDDLFMVPKKDGTKEPMSYPGDPAGSAGNVINCRCALRYRRIGSLSGA
jgi:uncharacterized protein with gpF-like domain